MLWVELEGVLDTRLLRHQSVLTGKLIQRLGEENVLERRSEKLGVAQTTNQYNLF